MALARLAWDIMSDILPLVIKHKGNRAAITAHLNAEREWARFCARHGLPRNTPHDAP